MSAPFRPALIAALVVMLAGPLLQGLSGATDPNAYIFAPIIAVAVLPLGGPRDMAGSLRLAGLFLAIGAACLALWWLGGLVTPMAIPGWLPIAVTVVGAVLPILARFR